MACSSNDLSDKVFRNWFAAEDRNRDPIVMHAFASSGVERANSFISTCSASRRSDTKKPMTKSVKCGIGWRKL
jgi:hypothetical protein